MADIGAKAPPALNTALLASMSEHTEHVSPRSGANMPSHEGGESQHPFMQDQLIQAGLGHTLRSNTLNGIVPHGSLAVPGAEQGGVFGEQPISLGNQELAKIGHDYSNGLVGIAETGFGDLGAQFNFKKPTTPRGQGEQQH